LKRNCILREARGLTVAAMCGVLLATVVISLGLGILMRLTLRALDMSLRSLVVDVGDEIAQILAAAAGLVILRYWTRQTWMSLVPLRKWGVPLYLPLLVSVLGLALLTAALRASVLAVSGPVVPVVNVTKAQSFVVLFSALVLAPFAEELLMRGAVLGGLLKRYPKREAVLLSSLAFAVLHFSPYQFLQSIALGLVVGWVRVTIASLWPGILAHTAFNAFLFLVGTDVFAPGVSAMLGTVLFVLGLLWIRSRVGEFQHRGEGVT